VRVSVPSRRRTPRPAAQLERRSSHRRKEGPHRFLRPLAISIRHRVTPGRSLPCPPMHIFQDGHRAPYLPPSFPPAVTSILTRLPFSSLETLSPPPPPLDLSPRPRPPLLDLRDAAVARVPVSSKVMRQG
jgi:hypothetical protein